MAKRGYDSIKGKEKLNPGYIKAIEIENSQLKKSLESTQNQSASIQQKNLELEKENSILKERVGSKLKDISNVLFGSGLSYIFEKNYLFASILIAVGYIILSFQDVFQTTTAKIQSLFNKNPK